MCINDINDILVYLQLPSFRMDCSLQNTIVKNGKAELQKISTPRKKMQFILLLRLSSYKSEYQELVFPLN